MRTHHDATDVRRMIDAMVGAVADEFAGAAAVNIVGIRTRGEVLAARLAAGLEASGITVGRGVLDITLYRDDLSEIGPRPLVRPTELSIDLDGRPLVLVDDVIFTGRSVRAALDALADFGRPSVVKLAVLVDRGGRELPIQPDLSALTLADVPRDHRVNVRLAETDGVDEIVVEKIPTE